MPVINTDPNLPQNGGSGLQSSPVDQTIGSGSFIPTGSLYGSSIPTDGLKLTEVANSMKWGQDGLSNVSTPTEFSALTNGNLSSSMNSALTGIGAEVSSKFSSYLPTGLTASLMGKLTGDITNGIGNIGIAKYGVKLVSRITGENFIFDAMPSISESGSVSYTEVDIIQHPGTILKYQTTPSREWTISNIKLISLTAPEASRNQKQLNLLRSWRMPYYGDGTAKSAGTKLGAPPDVLFFSAYGQKNIGKMPVVLMSYSTEWTNDVDYIHTSEGEPFPVILTLSITVKEAYSPREFSGFDLAAFRAGDLANAYKVRVQAQKAKKSSNSSVSAAKGEPPKDASNPAVKVPAECTAADAKKAGNSSKVLHSGELPSASKAEVAQAIAKPPNILSTPTNMWTSTETSTGNSFAADAAAGIFTGSGTGRKDVRFLGK